MTKYSVSLALDVSINGWTCGKHKRHGCRKRLAGDFEGGSTLEQEHESKCAKVHVIVASLSPMIDNSSGSVRYFDGQLTDGKTYCRVVGSALVLSIAHQCGSERGLSSQTATKHAIGTCSANLPPDSSQPSPRGSFWPCCCTSIAQV